MTMDFATLASTRRSIRKYTPEDVDLDDIRECVRTAVTAPSGCNSQCWKFVVVRDRSMIDKLADAVSAAVVATAKGLSLEDETYLESKIRFSTFFRSAPVCVAVFMTRLDYYDKRMEAAYEAAGVSHEDAMEALSDPDILSIGAAVQTFLLALHEKGYGACWMNEPAFARAEISRLLGVGPEARFMSLIPVGRPAYAPKSKAYKPLDEVLTVVG